jgi:hypothetical protein
VIPRLITAVLDLLSLIARPWEVIKRVVLLFLLSLIHVSASDMGVTAETRLTISGSVYLTNLILLNHPYKASALRIKVLYYLEKATICSYFSRFTL